MVLGLVAIAAFILSFSSLEHLGKLAGYGALSWLYPVVVDLGAVASCASWLHERSRQALLMTWGLLGVSVVLNGTVHWLVATGRTPSWGLITLVATVPPAVLGLVVHLAVGRPSLGSAEVRTISGATAKFTEPTEGNFSGGAEVSTANDPIPEGIGRRRLAKELDITEHAARQLLASRNGPVR